MSNLYNTILNMSITGSVVILVVILVRFLLRNTPKKYSYILWAVAGFRLCCPFSFKSVVSLFSINPVQKPGDIVTNRGTMNYIDAPVYFQTPTTNMETIGEADAPATFIVQYHFTDFIPYIWILGLILLAVIGIVNFIKTKKQLSTAARKYDNIYQSECITSPFILGIIKPKIYVPYNMEEAYFDYVIAHEKYHLKRGDNIIKLFSFVLLCIHWFNPFCWLAFYLANKDMEMSCDEWVLSHNDGIKKVYSNALLSFATERKFPTPTPLCFGEGSAKSRIQNVLKYKKPTVIISVIAIILCIAVAAVCLANPKENTISDYDFIYDNYWYNVYDDGDDTIVVCSKYNHDYTIDSAVYTIDKNDKWSTEYEEHNFSFDENNTIVVYDSGTEYSLAWWYMNTETGKIEERDKNNGEVIQTLIPRQENSVLEVQKVLELYQNP